MVEIIQVQNEVEREVRLYAGKANDNLILGISDEWKPKGDIKRRKFCLIQLDKSQVEKLKEVL